MTTRLLTNLNSLCPALARTSYIHMVTQCLPQYLTLRVHFMVPGQATTSELVRNQWTWCKWNRVLVMWSTICNSEKCIFHELRCTMVKYIYRYIAFSVFNGPLWPLFKIFKCFQTVFRISSAWKACLWQVTFTQRTLDYRKLWVIIEGNRQGGSPKCTSLLRSFSMFPSIELKNPF